MGRLGTERQIGKRDRGTKDDGEAPRGWGLNVTRKLAAGRGTNRSPRAQIREPERRVSPQTLGCTVRCPGLWRRGSWFGGAAGRAGASAPGLHSISTERMGDQIRNLSTYLHHLVDPSFLSTVAF